MTSRSASSVAAAAQMPSRGRFELPHVTGTIITHVVGTGIKVLVHVHVCLYFVVLR